MVDKSDTSDFTFKFIDSTTSSPTDASEIKMRRRDYPQTSYDVYIIEQNNTLQIKNSNTFKQLANYGFPNTNPADTTDLVLNNDYIGKNGSGVQLGSVDLEISCSDNNFTNPNAPTSNQIYGWNSSESLSNNGITTNVDGTYDLTLSTPLAF